MRLLFLKGGERVSIDGRIYACKSVDRSSVPMNATNGFDLTPEEGTDATLLVLDHHDKTVAVTIGARTYRAGDQIEAHLVPTATPFGFTARHAVPLGSTKAAEAPAKARDVREKVEGPTIEEFVAAGYDPAIYPQSHFDEKPSPGLTYYRENGKMPETFTATGEFTKPVETTTGTGGEAPKQNDGKSNEKKPELNENGKPKAGAGKTK